LAGGSSRPANPRPGSRTVTAPSCTATLAVSNRTRPIAAHPSPDHHSLRSPESIPPVLTLALLYSTASSAGDPRLHLRPRRGSVNRIEARP
jgi:hypothetical protein